MKILSRLLIAALLLGAAACSKNTKNTVTTADGNKVTVEQKGDQVNYELQSKSGEKVSLRVSDKGVKLATELPKDIPLYPKAVIKMDNTMGAIRMLGLNISASVDDGVKYYTDELKAQGWTIDASMAMGEGHMLQTKKDARSCAVMITKDGKETYVQLTLTTKD